MKKIVMVLMFCSVVFSFLQAQQGKGEAIQIEPIDQDRVYEITAMLADEPKGYGVPYTDRSAWERLLKSGVCKPVIVAADQYNEEPFPPMTEEIYMSFFEGKDSETSKKLTTRRRLILATLVWAECLTGRGKYMPAIETAMDNILTTRSWNFPAEDRQLTNYNGTQYTVTLASADLASEIAQTLYLLADKIKPEMREKAMKMLRERVFNPTIQAIETKNENREFKGLLDKGNHNSVTLSGVTNAVLTVIKDKKERATFIAIAERYSKNSLAGFTEDGYCSEGVAYYNYGMGFYNMLRETIWQATSGKVDLLEDPKMKKIGLFLPKSEIMNDVYPAIGDCSPNPKPYGPVLYYLNKNLNLGLTAYDTVKAPAKAPLTNLMYFFPNSASLATADPEKVYKEGLRSYFENAGVLTVRPASDSGFNMGATLKGGNNSENHNHNDLGSFSIVLGNEMIMGDMGFPTYTPKTFSPERYTAFKMIASYGHNVPLPAGVQQREGRASKAIITEAGFTNDEDKFTMDISSAYHIKGLAKMTRSFTYNRTEMGFLEVTDEVAFDSPQTYETALTTRGKWKQLSENTIEISGKKEKLIVTISAPESGFTVVSETIKEATLPYTRIGIRLKEPLQSGTIKMVFTPIKK